MQDVATYDAWPRRSAPVAHHLRGRVGTVSSRTLTHDYVLGISAFYHDSAACLVHDGKIVAAAQEERFTRKKGDASFPTPPAPGTPPA